MRNEQGNNEINSLKLSIFKALRRSSLTSNANIGYMKNISVDLPLSEDIFNNFFKKNIPDLRNRNSESINCKISINDLKHVLGENWFIYNRPNSSTRQRVLGLIQLSYRDKSIKLTIRDINRYYDSLIVFLD